MSKIDLNIKYTAPMHRVFEDEDKTKRVVCTIRHCGDNIYVLHPEDLSYELKTLTEDKLLFLLKQGYIQKLYSYNKN